MPIAHFGPAQADVYIPAVIALTVAAVLVAIPLVLAPTLRGRAGLAVRLGSIVLAAVAVVGAVALAVPAQQALAAQVPAVQQRIADRYGLHLSGAVVSRLIDGSTVPGSEVSSSIHAGDTVKLVASGSGYQLVSTLSSQADTSPLPTR